MIREIVERGDVKISKIPSADNAADLLTKQLSQSLHEGHVRAFGLRPMSEWD